MNAAQAPGFPVVGRTIPTLALTAVTVVVGALLSWFVVGLSGWLVVSLLLVLAAAFLPRSPFVAILVIQLTVAELVVGPAGYTGRFALLLFGSHVLHATGALTDWLPRGARLQLSVLRRPVLRFVPVQVGVQVAAFAVLALAHGLDGRSFVWLGVVGAAAALVLGLTLLVPVLLRPSRSGVEA